MTEPWMEAIAEYEYHQPTYTLRMSPLRAEVTWDKTKTLSAREVKPMELNTERQVLAYQLGSRILDNIEGLPL